MIIQTFVWRTLSASELNLRRRQLLNFIHGYHGPFTDPWHSSVCTEHCTVMLSRRLNLNYLNLVTDEDRKAVVWVRFAVRSGRLSQNTLKCLLQSPCRLNSLQSHAASRDCSSIRITDASLYPPSSFVIIRPRPAKSPVCCCHSASYRYGATVCVEPRH